MTLPSHTVELLSILPLRKFQRLCTPSWSWMLLNSTNRIGFDSTLSRTAVVYAPLNDLECYWIQQIVWCDTDLSQTEVVYARLNDLGRCWIQQIAWFDTALSRPEVVYACHSDLECCWVQQISWFNFINFAWALLTGFKMPTLFFKWPSHLGASILIIFNIILIAGATTRRNKCQKLMWSESHFLLIFFLYKYYFN